MPEPAPTGPPATHVVLIGSMGAGKTTIGTRVAAALAIPFEDGDSTLEARYHANAREIADHLGIDALHDREAAVAWSLVRVPSPTVIALAASVVDVATLRARLAREFVVWLSAPPEVLVARAAKQAYRPLLDGPQAIDEFVVRETRRAEHYGAIADLVVDTSDTSKGARDAEATRIVVAWHDAGGSRRQGDDVRQERRAPAS
jgi:shikimate kinase